MSNGKILYFGYGANRDKRMMEAITGRNDLVGHPGTLYGYELCVQRLDQVPNAVFPTAPVQESPQQILLKAWLPVMQTKEKIFTTYIIRPAGDFDRRYVDGMIWELPDLQSRELVRDWELIDFGWYQDILARAKSDRLGEVYVQTEGLRSRHEQEIDHVIEGRDYETWLNDPEDFFRIAAHAREEFLARQAKTKEGHE